VLCRGYLGRRLARNWRLRFGDGHFWDYKMEPGQCDFKCRVVYQVHR
jgi:hypothetical protein